MRNYLPARCVECLAGFDDGNSHQLAISAGVWGLPESGRSVVRGQHVTQLEPRDETFSHVDKDVHGDRHRRDLAWPR